jgi:uncharacterized circularly permuted ATP-grasp superfamily protein
MKTTKGLRKVDVIYRRIDDDFIDPTVSERIPSRVSGIIEATAKAMSTWRTPSARGRG